MNFEIESFEQFYKSVNVPVKNRKKLSKVQFLETYGAEFIKEFNFDKNSGASLNQMILIKIQNFSDFRNFKKFVYVLEKDKSHCSIFGFRD